MFFHGIDLNFLKKQFPVLSPRKGFTDKTLEQIYDRKHLMERFGLEPVHLLESDDRDFSIRRCIRECAAFGNVILAFETLPLPMWQLSRHEVGIPILDVRECCWAVVCRPELKQELRFILANIRIIEYDYKSLIK